MGTGNLVRGTVLIFLLGELVTGACSTPTRSGVLIATPIPTSTPKSLANANLSPTTNPSSTATATLTAVPTPQAKLSALFDYTRAVILLETGLYEDAIPAFGLVIRRLPEFAQAYHGRGLAHYHGEWPKLAMEDFNRAIEMKPDFAYAYGDRAVLHYEGGDSAKAVSDLEMALSLYDHIRDGDKITAAHKLQETIKLGFR